MQTGSPQDRKQNELQSFLGAVQFYSKYLPGLSTVSELLHRLTNKAFRWHGGVEERSAFQQLKDMLCAETVQAHFDPSLPNGITCDVSEVGVGAVLFHWYDDGNERPIDNALKTLTDIQCRYGKIQLETQKGCRSKVSAGYHSRHFYNAAITITAFRTLGVYPRTNHYAEDSNPGQ